MSLDWRPFFFVVFVLCMVGWEAIPRPGINNNKRVVQDCGYSGWSDWSPAVCPVNCQLTRAQTSSQGAACPPITSTKQCNNGLCVPVDCVWSVWSLWTTCTVACGGGSQFRNRTILVPAVGNGMSCMPPYNQTGTCNTQLCDCVYTTWTSWTPCSAICKQTRTRTAVGSETGCTPQDKMATGDCTAPPCSINCTLSGWSDWGACTVLCNGGTSTRTRSIVSPAIGLGSCSNDPQSQICNTQNCSQPCQWNSWGPWGNCSAPCGTGFQTRARTILSAATGDAPACSPSDSMDQKTCKIVDCPIDCAWNAWSAWGDCSAPCGTGTQIRLRNIMTQPQFGGQACQPSDAQGMQPCNTQMCIPQDCVWSAWSAWSDCSKACNTGYITRTRTKAVVALYGGKDCPDVPLQQLPCNTVPCAVDCYFMDWTDWGPCSVDCSTGISTRTRQKVPEENGGAPCDPTAKTSQVQNCNTQACGVDCTWNAWSPYTDCSADCGGGTQTRTRSKNSAQFGGKDCVGDPTQSTMCNVNPCPIPCTWNTWSPFAACSLPCGGGLATRTRTQNPAMNQGAGCQGSSSESLSCNVVKCANGPVDCSWNDWGAWGDCSKTCGGGVEKRSRTMNTAQNGGNPCDGSSDDTSSCNTDDCPADCVWGTWSPFTDCSAQCDGGIQKRTRVPSTTDPSVAPCPGQSEQVVACNIAPCSFAGVDPCLNVKCPAQEECQKQGTNAGVCAESANYPVVVFTVLIDVIGNTTITDVTNLMRQAAIPYILHNSLINFQTTHNGGTSYTVSVSVTKTSETDAALETFKDSMSSDLAGNDKFTIKDFSDGVTVNPVTGPPPTSGKIPTANSGLITGHLGPEVGPEQQGPYFGFLPVSSQGLAIGILLIIIITPLVLIIIVAVVLFRRSKTKVFEDYEQL